MFGCAGKVVSLLAFHHSATYMLSVEFLGKSYFIQGLAGSMSLPGVTVSGLVHVSLA